MVVVLIPFYGFDAHDRKDKKRRDEKQGGKRPIYMQQHQPSALRPSQIPRDAPSNLVWMWLLLLLSWGIVANMQ